MTDEQLAWLTGFLEAKLGGTDQRYKLEKASITLYHEDQQSLERFRDYLGAGTVQATGQSNSRFQYEFTAFGGEVLIFINKVWQDLHSNAQVLLAMYVL